MVCRVVCGLLEVIATLCPTSALVSVDLPALGRPTRQANPARKSAFTTPPRGGGDGRGPREPPGRRRPRRPPSGGRPGSGRRGAGGARSRWRSGGDARPSARPVSRRPATSPVDPGMGTRPIVLAEQAADGVDLLLLDGDTEQLGEVVDVHRGRHPGGAVRQLLDAGGSRSYSSAISPTISSRMSSMVTRPAVPPYSSMTTAKWNWPRCISRSRSSIGLLSGMWLHRPHRVQDMHRRRAGVGVDAAGDVLEVEQAEHVVRAVADDRDAGEARAQEQRHRLPQGLVRARW